MSWRNDYGWLVVLYARERKHYRRLPSGTTYEEARAAMNEAMKSDPAFEKAWLIQKES